MYADWLLVTVAPTTISKKKWRKKNESVRQRAVSKIKINHGVMTFLSFLPSVVMWWKLAGCHRGPVRERKENDEDEDDDGDDDDDDLDGGDGDRVVKGESAWVRREGSVFDHEEEGHEEEEEEEEEDDGRGVKLSAGGGTIGFVFGHEPSLAPSEGR
jgi:hypothetical protein